MRASFDAAVMHDYFVDRIVHTKDLGGLTSSIRAKAGAGGGGIHGVSQEDVAGGNAVNMARALATLGARTLLVTHSDPEHRSLLSRAFAGLAVELRVKALPPGLTVALEERHNVMLGESGGAGAFGPRLLGGKDWLALRNSRIVCSLNWSANARGTELLVALRRRLGKGRTIFIDPADFRDRMPAYRKFLRLVRKKRLIDWLSLNQQEAMVTAKLLDADARSPGRACLGISRVLGARVDVHSSEAAFTSSGSEVVSCATRRSRPRRLTGAGDVWNGASIYAHLHGMADERRLAFANAAARLYIQAESPKPPTEGEVMAALG